MKIYTAAIDGLNLTKVNVEADISNGLPSFSIVGLGDTSIKEARERIRPALKNSGFKFPPTKKVINLAPADIKKQGSHFDLPIAVSMLEASGQILSGHEFDGPDEKVFCAGELMLNGNVRKIPGALPITHFARKLGYKRIFIPHQNRKEASMIKGIDILPVKNINEIVMHLEKTKLIKPYVKTDTLKTGSNNKQEFFMNNADYTDFSQICGQEIPKRALEIAAASGHHILMYGPPGTGKTILAKAFPSILPDLNESQSMEVSMIYSVAAGKHKLTLPIKKPQVRHVHHTISAVTLLGGGSSLEIGEATLAHRGVLFLDEIAEFDPNTLENLREPLQEGIIRLGRNGKTVSLPANFQLIAAMNPCPCGYYGDTKKNCQCSQHQIKNYYKKISGPILDRIDLIVEVPRIQNKKLLFENQSESSKTVRRRVENARKRQKERGFLNSEIELNQVKTICNFETEAEDLLELIADKMNLSPRSYLSLIRVSRTIADIDNSVSIKTIHIAEAAQYRKSFVY